MIPLTYFAESNDLELIIRDGFAVVQQKNARPVFHTHEKRADMLREIAAFEAQHNHLVKEHLGEYVAIYQGKVVAYNIDHLHLTDKIDQDFPNEVVLIRKVNAELPTPLRFPNLRLATSQ